jgi:flavin-dependent dehydrogenase
MDADVVVIGGGPAGSTCASLLAKAGHAVVVLEKERFPRFHIGESLLPCDLPIFDRLGITLDEGPFVRKGGAEFLDERTGEHEVFPFSDGLPGTPGHAYQVERALFDHLLLTRARENGAAVREGERATDVVLARDHVEATTASATVRARYLVDATGQDAFLARRARSVEPLRDFGIAAVFCHFDGLASDVAASLTQCGNIHVLLVDDGWVWLIPLHGGRLSCGVVSRKTGVTESLLERTLERSPHIQRLTRGATRTPARIIRNFSYRNAHARGPRWSCIGDASLFLDPVFSSGVSLAMLGGERAADLLSAALREGREGEPELMAPVAERMRTAYVSFASLIGAFYKTRIVENVFFAPNPDPGLRSGLISLLAGDVWRDDNRFQRMLVESSKRRIDPTAVTGAGGSAS